MPISRQSTTHAPQAAAFTAFTKTSSGYTFYPADFNVAGPWNNGWYFYNRLTSPDATIFCPSVNMRSPTDGKLDGRAFSCWSITPGYGTYAREDVFYSSTNGGSACAYAVFPMADE